MCELTAERWKLWIQEVDKLTRGGMAAVKAFKVVAERYRVSPESVKKAYYRTETDACNAPKLTNKE